MLKKFLGIHLIKTSLEIHTPYMTYTESAVHQGGCVNFNVTLDLLNPKKSGPFCQTKGTPPPYLSQVVVKLGGKFF